MNTTIVIILSFLLGNMIHSDYIYIFFFSTSTTESASWFSNLAHISSYIALVSFIILAIVKEKNNGLKLVQMLICLVMVSFFYLRAVNEVEHFKTHPVRFYQYAG